MGRRGEEEDPSPLVSMESLDGVGFMHVAIAAVVSSIAVAVGDAVDCRAWVRDKCTRARGSGIYRAFELRIWRCGQLTVQIPRRLPPSNVSRFNVLNTRN